jgi:hypothetical protein
MIERAAMVEGVHVKCEPNEGMAGKRAQRKTNKNMIALDD